MEILNIDTFSHLVVRSEPYASAVLYGNDENRQISGTVRFYTAAEGTLVVAEVFGLPPTIMEKGEMKPAGPFYAFHIHEGTECGSGAGDAPFAASKTHFNPTNQPHPMHAGDLPPLLGNNGYAYLAVYTDRFTPEQVVGRTMIVHAQPDDFRTQPSGNAGMKIACGVIKLSKMPFGKENRS